MTETHSSGTLVIIGGDDPASMIADFIEVTGTSPQRTLLVTPLPTTAQMLEQSFADTASVTVIEGLLGAGDDTAEWLTYNAPGLAGIHAPTTELRRIWPGLRVQSRQPVTSLAMSDIQDQLADAPRPLTLWIDMAGSERDILDAWDAAGFLDVVDTLVLRCGARPFFANSAGQTELLSWLRDRNFTLSDFDSSDPEWPVLTALPAPATPDFEGRIASLTAALAAEREALREAQEEIIQLQGKQSPEQADMGLALRMQAVAQSDLEDLRNKYRDVCLQRDQQQALLNQLSPRLHQAASQLKALSAAEPEETPQVLPETPKTTTGRAPKSAAKPAPKTAKKAPAKTATRAKATAKSTTTTRRKTTRSSKEKVSDGK